MEVCKTLGLHDYIMVGRILILFDFERLYQSNMKRKLGSKG